MKRIALVLALVFALDAVPARAQGDVKSVGHQVRTPEETLR